MKCLVKVNPATLMKRLDREASTHWGLNQAKANAIEARLLTVVKSNQPIALALVKQGHLSPIVLKG